MTPCWFSHIFIFRGIRRCYVEKCAYARFLNVLGPLSCGPTSHIKWLDSWSSHTHTYTHTTAALWWKEECYSWGLDPPSTRLSPPTSICSPFCARLNPSSWVQPMCWFGCLTFSVGQFTAGYGTGLVGSVRPPPRPHPVPRHCRCRG